MLTKLLTRNLKSLPLFRVDINIRKLRKSGKVDSCTAHVHPLLSEDEHIKSTMNELIDYIRDNYDMEELI